MADFFPTLAELGGAKLPERVTIDGKPFTPMFHGQNSGGWMRNWIFVMLHQNWYDRELSWKLNESGELFDMQNAPFAEPLVPADTQNGDALAARQRLQTVLTQLNPSAGKVGPVNSKKNGKANNGKKKANEAGDSMDNQNANAPDQ